MLPLPRIALGTVQPEAEIEFVSWALMELLSRRGCQVQHFMARCCLTPLPGAITATGLGLRHLDSWLMTPEVCRELLLRGTGESELALVEGRYDAGRPAGLRRRQPGPALPMARHASPGCAATFAGWIAASCRPGLRPMDCYWTGSTMRLICRAGRRRSRVSGAYPFWVRWKIAAAARGDPRAAPGSSVPRDLCEHLARCWSRCCKPDAIRRLAARREFDPGSSTLFQPLAGSSPITVAVAYDEAFHCYFPDTLDLLELLGASIIDFSPLHDESLPPETDLVYIGCGHPERFATELSDNHCMMLALRNHLCAGRRIYADGGGLAYLCQYLETPEGKWGAMVGALRRLLV